MLEFLYSIAGFVIALGILVAVHEFGHFWVARKLGVKVLKFSVGFGKAIWSRTASDGTIYAIGAIPLGGYVKMLDENEGDVAEQDLHRAFNRQPIWKRSLVVLAGPMFNFFFATDGFRSGDVLLSVDGRKLNTWEEQRLYLFSKALARKTVNYEVQTVDGQQTTRSLNLANVPMSKIDARLVAGGIGLIGWYPDVPAVIDQVVSGKPASMAGLQQGDLITAIDGEQVASWNDVVKLIAASPGKPLQLVFTRKGYSESVSITPEVALEGEQQIGRIGISVQAIEIPEDRIVNVNYGLACKSLTKQVQTLLLPGIQLSAID
jgi:regulator of sigma E protease